MYHGRLSALSGQCIHITGPHRNSCIFLRLMTDSLHICAEQRIHTGNTDHYNRRLLLKSFADLCHRLWNLFQMSSRYNIRLIHQQIIKPVMIRPHGAENRSIASAASRRYNQHNRIRHRQTCALHTESFCSRRVKSQRRRGAVDQMGMGNQLFGNILFS